MPCKNKLIWSFVFIASISINTVDCQNDQNRLALVIGNAAYQHGGALKNPVNDAKLMSQTLKNLGFDVIESTDASLIEMKSVFKQFATQIKKYDVSLFFYAGHGMQIDGENYLIPVDSKLEDKYSLEFEALKLSIINRYFALNSDNLNIMILDACRNDPYRSWSRGGNRGFSAVGDQGAGTIIAFATREGETASDGIGSNGLFTHHLVEQMNIKQNITDVFQNTRVSVLKASNKQQIPQEWNMLTGNFYFTQTVERGKIITSDPTVISTSEEKTQLGTSLSNYHEGVSTFLDEYTNTRYGTIGFKTTDSEGNVAGMVWLTENVNSSQAESFKIPGTNDFLYTWQSAMKACPKGSHLASKAEWELLVTKYGGPDTAAKALKATQGWKVDTWSEIGNGSNNSGMNIRPFGYRNDFGTFSGLGVGGYFWTSTDTGRKAQKITLYYNENEVEISTSDKENAYSCRCVLN